MVISRNLHVVRYRRTPQGFLRRSGRSKDNRGQTGQRKKPGKGETERTEHKEEGGNALKSSHTPPKPRREFSLLKLEATQTTPHRQQIHGPSSALPDENSKTAADCWESSHFIKRGRVWLLLVGRKRLYLEMQTALSGLNWLRIL